MEAQNPNKRLRQVPCVSSSTSQTQNPNSLPNVPGFNQNHFDLIISSFLSLPDLPSSLSIECSFDRVLEKLFEASGDDSVHDSLAVRTLQLTSLLQESTKKWYRKYATLFNSNSWPLLHDLTVKVFSMLDTKSLMQASACCTLFKKCAMEPLCYSHIDLTTAYVDSGVVRSMIFHAGKELRSLKVGRIDESTPSLLTGSCLTLLSYNHCFKGNLLRSLHIYNNRWLDDKSLRGALSACSNLTDLKIVGLNVDPLDMVVDYLPRECQHLFIEHEIEYGRSRFLHVSSFGRKWPNITSLSLIGFDINDSDAHFLIMGLRKLKYMNLSRTSEINGSFLRDVRHDCEDTLLETLILRDCSSLQERNVCRFLDSLLRVHLRFVRHIDVSNNRGGLICGGRRCSKPMFPLDELKEERPGLTFVADFTSLSSSSSSQDTSYSSG